MGELDIRSRSNELTALSVRHTPDTGATDCHTVSITQGAASGRGSAVHVIADNTASTAVVVRSAGALLRLYDASGTQRLSVAGDGATTVTGSLTVSGALTAGSQSISGNLTVTGTLGVTGAATLGNTLTVTGATTLSSSLAVTGAATLSSTLGVTGAATLSSTLAVTGSVTLGGALTVTGYTTLAGAQANSDFTVFGDLSVLGSGKGYRFRRSGSSLDLEATGVDLLLSNWSGTSFDGTQRSYDRYSADAMNVQHAGKREYVSALYGAVVHTIDPTTGVASLGGKNSLTPIKLCGQKATAGAPTTGTWNAGDTIIDALGLWHQCLTGGTPGTWS